MKIKKEKSQTKGSENKKDIYLMKIEAKKEKRILYQGKKSLKEGLKRIKDTVKYLRSKEAKNTRKALMFS